FTPFEWDVNLVGADAFIENNYAFFERTHFPEVLRQLSNEIVLRPDVTDDTEIAADQLVVDFYREPRSRFLAVASSVTGPSALVQLPGQQSIGLLTRARAMITQPRIPANLNYYKLDTLSIATALELEPTMFATMAWNELGLHYGKLFETYDGQFAIGANLKFLSGYEAAYIRSNTALEVKKLPNDSVQLNNLSLAYGFTNGNTSGNEEGLQRNGRGVGADIGISFTIDGYEDTYRWRFGLAIRDIGFIAFNRNAEAYELIVGDIVELSVEDYEQYDSIEQLDEAIANFNADVLANTLQNNIMRTGFRVALPTTFSLQADYGLNEYIYFNAHYVHPLAVGDIPLQRNSLLAFTPRFEHRWFGAALPLSTYNWQDFRVGIAMRLAFLTIGSDNLGSIVRRSDFTGTDVYMALKINPFQTNWGGKYKGKRKRGKVVCPPISR
ncbi:MAG: DUF5723 family protein, partial [Bacteroidota bacterium]